MDFYTVSQDLLSTFICGLELADLVLVVHIQKLVSKEENLSLISMNPPVKYETP